MPLFSFRPIRKQEQKFGSILGDDVLKMYKLFPKDLNPEDNSKGYCLTRVLMSDNSIWHRITKHGVARGKPGGKREREWKHIGYTDKSDDQVRHEWRAQGFILPRGYWVGPRHLKPTRLIEEKLIDDWSPDMLREKIVREKSLTEVNRELGIVESKPEPELKPEEKKELRPIPKLAESWFWDSSPKVQAELMKAWGYENEFIDNLIKNKE